MFNGIWEGIVAFFFVCFLLGFCAAAFFFWLAPIVWSWVKPVIHAWTA